MGFPAIRGNRLSGRMQNNILCQIALWHSIRVVLSCRFFARHCKSRKLKLKSCVNLETASCIKKEQLSMFSTPTKSGTTRPHKSWQLQWNWTESQYRELNQLYMNFVDHHEITKGRSPVKPHRNQVLIQCAFGLFARVAPRNCILSALKVCNILEEEPYELTMNPMAEPRDVNIHQRTQWDILKVERIKDQTTSANSRSYPLQRNT